MDHSEGLNRKQRDAPRSDDVHAEDAGISELDGVDIGIGEKAIIEIDNDRFMVRRSLDGKNRFQLYKENDKEFEIEKSIELIVNATKPIATRGKPLDIQLSVGGEEFGYLSNGVVSKIDVQLG